MSLVDQLNKQLDDVRRVARSPAAVLTLPAALDALCHTIGGIIRDHENRIARIERAIGPLDAVM